FDSGSCKPSTAKFANVFQVTSGASDIYVDAFFNNTLSLCIPGGCATCANAVTGSDTFVQVRGVAIVAKGATAGYKAAVAPVEDVDMPRPTTVRALLAAPPAVTSPLTPVTLSNVVVVGHHESATSANLYVQDPGGGRYSGIQVFCSTSAEPTCLTTIQGLVAGDVIDVTGGYSVFSTYTPEVIASTTGPVHLTITKVGSTIAPVAATVAAANVQHASALTTGGAIALSPRFAAYDQVLVTLAGPVSVSATSVSPDLMSTCTGGKTDWKGFALSNGDIYVGDLFGPTNMSMCVVDQCDDAGCMGTDVVNMGDSFASVTGVARLSKNTQVQIAP